MCIFCTGSPIRPASANTRARLRGISGRPDYLPDAEAARDGRASPLRYVMPASLPSRMPYLRYRCTRHGIGSPPRAPRLGRAAFDLDRVTTQVAQYEPWQRRSQPQLKSGAYPQSQAGLSEERLPQDCCDRRR